MAHRGYSSCLSNPEWRCVDKKVVLRGRFVQGTTATAYLDLSSEKTAGSVRAVASSFLESLELLPDTKEPFSIRDWVSGEQDDSWLFLSCTNKAKSKPDPPSQCLALSWNPNSAALHVIFCQ